VENVVMNRFLLSVAGFVAAPALAQTAPMIHTPPAGMMATRVEARAEIVARTQRMFAMLDTNHDNVLDQAELAAAGKRWNGAREAGSGMATGRMPLDRNAMFDMIDADHDGTISRDEFARAPTHHGEGAGMEGHHEGMGKATLGMGMGGAMARMWTMADANHDGRVTLQEATDLALAHFDRMDANHDGQLTPDERAAGRAEMGQMRGQ
jgi:Ca2+-binding EF-hand superfamily protein